MTNLITLKPGTANLLSTFGHDTLEREFIESKVIEFARISNAPELTLEEIEEITRKLEERFSITMTLGTIFDTEDYRPWLDELRGDMDWYYWRRYKQFLLNGGFPIQVIRGLDNISDQILDHLENPLKPGSLETKGDGSRLCSIRENSKLYWFDE